MTKEIIKQMIVDSVIDNQGCKLMDLVKSDIFMEAWRDLDTLETLDDFVDELVKEDRLVAVRYVLPIMHHKLKLFLLPAGTHIAVVIGNDLTVIGEE